LKETVVFCRPSNHWCVAHRAWRFVIALECAFRIFNNDEIREAFLAVILETPDPAQGEIFQSVAIGIRLMLPYLRHTPLNPDNYEKMRNILICGLFLRLDRGSPVRLELIRTFVEFLLSGVSSLLSEFQALPELIAEFPDGDEKKQLARSVGIEL
jgi:hypothetical protein